MSESWMAYGRCVEESPDVFFPSDGLGVEKAKKLSARSA